MSDDEAPDLIALEGEVKTESVSDTVPGTTPVPVPVCILTGWLGAGKTTLLTRLVKEVGASGKKIAIIQNEASALGVEEALLLKDDSGLFGEMLELGNGCVCCSVKADFALAVETLMKKRKFDYVFLECSGLADPGPLAKMFWVDAELESHIYLDSIVTLVDAKHLESHLSDKQAHSNQVVRQIAFADVIILNKLDLVDSSQVDRLKAKLGTLNAGAKICGTTRSAVDLNDILYIKGFESANAVKFAASTSTAINNNTHCSTHHSHNGKACSQSCFQSTDDHVHDTTISSLVLTLNGRVDETKVTKWLGDLLWKHSYDSLSTAESKEVKAKHTEREEDIEKQEKKQTEQDNEMEIFRMKGLFWVASQKQPYFLQGVSETFEFWPSELSVVAVDMSVDENRVVVIGRNLDSELLQNGLDACL